MKTTVFDIINDVYDYELLVFVWATFREKLVSLHRAVNEVVDSCIYMRRASLKTVAGTEELIGRLVGVKLPKTADHLSVRN